MSNNRRKEEEHKSAWVRLLLAVQLAAFPAFASAQDELGSFYLSDALVHYILLHLSDNPGRTRGLGAVLCCRRS
jgi:hypothetical protein